MNRKNKLFALSVAGFMAFAPAVANAGFPVSSLDWPSGLDNTVKKDSGISSFNGDTKILSTKKHVEPKNNNTKKRK